MTALYSSLIALLIVSGLWLSTELKNHSIQSPWIIATIWDTAIFLCLAFIAFVASQPKQSVWSRGLRQFSRYCKLP